MELNKVEFTEKATKLIEENNELGLIILCTVNRKKVNNGDDRETQMKKLKDCVRKNFHIGYVEYIWLFIKNRN